MSKIEITEKELIHIIEIKLEIEQLNNWLHENKKNICIPICEISPFKIQNQSTSTLIALIEAIKNGNLIFNTNTL